jgi:hypothetical protein
MLTLILHSHRYKKVEEFTKEKDFSIVRDPMYKYSTEAKNRFFSDPWLAFFFHYFYVFGRSAFVCNKKKKKSSTDEVETDIGFLNYLEKEPQEITPDEGMLKILEELDSDALNSIYYSSENNPLYDISENLEKDIDAFIYHEKSSSGLLNI